MSCFDTEKSSLENACSDPGMSACAAAMTKDPYWSPSENSLNVASSLPGSSQSQTDLQGYDVEFDPPLESKYECPICLMALRDAVQTPCGHRFCRSCIEKSIRDTGQKCPVDNEVLLEDQLFPDNFAKREILSLTVRCSNGGCNEKMELRHLDSHVTDCKFATVPCPQCQDAVLKRALEEHKIQQCLRRIVSCSECAQPYVFEEKEAHEHVCLFASVVCAYCSLDLIRDQLESHCDTDCVKAPVNCTFSFFGCQVKMQRKDLALHMQEFTGMHMRYMAEYLRKQSLNGCGQAPGAHSDDRGAARGGDPCQCHQELQNMRETVQHLEGRLVLQDHQLRELSIHNDTQGSQLEEMRRKVTSLEETIHELEAKQCQGVYVWRLENFSAHLRNQEAGQPVVIHSPGFYTGSPGYKLCLRLHLQTPSAPRCANYISLFVHTMQGEFDGQLSWPFQGTIRLAILDQVESQHHVEVMETKPDLQAFQRPTITRNPKGFGYVTFLHLSMLQQRQFVRDDALLVRCEVTPRFDAPLHREGMQPRGPESSLTSQP
ncbi:TNF receptor-associated factor 6 isoform X2 [Denticeps clupeoides]|uniref:TNF receptor-associated factor n=1 Tax=Denticeps clupeoides TaxID=299321 RepID=A0AAY4EP73_9TELE|nr:TNF receptor-associated factor 6 isoform X2 [Denticeps clupeoides]XP_028812494.1 TNF receptor-associated factor 6 isoform X2 [Denticeps clupeoides]